MKFRATLAALAVLSATAMAQDADLAQDDHAGHDHEAEAMPADPAAVARDFGYTMGYTMARRMRADLGDVDTEAYLDGFRASMAGEAPRLDEQGMQEAIGAFQQQRMAELEAARAALAAKNAADGAAFLAKNGKRRGVKTLPSGLQVEVLKKGKGATPGATDLVTAHYTGTLPDGTEFDGSGEEPVQFPLDRVIPGWQEGVGMMNKGAKVRLYVPSALGYGERGAGEVIGPNQVLVFEVELVDFQPQPQEVPTGE